MSWRLLRGPYGESNRLLTVTAFPLSAGMASVSLWPACPDTISQRRVAIEVAGLGGSADLTGKYRFLYVRWLCALANGALGR